MERLFIAFLATIFFSIPIQAYIVLDGKTTVSPGCDGGVLSRTTTSYIKTPEELAEAIAAEENAKKE